MQYLVLDDTVEARRTAIDRPDARWTRLDDRTVIWGDDLQRAARDARGAGGVPDDASQLGLVV